jgi:eukaryotic-like serine/threonine-protein kinase
MPRWTVPGYTELRALGSGSFGEVVLARHDASGTFAAIKYLRPDLLADAEFAEMFRGEATCPRTPRNPGKHGIYGISGIFGISGISSTSAR